MELTTQDARALRNADSICFDHLPDGTGRIRAILRADHSSTGYEQVHIITAESSRIDDYQPEPHSGTYTGFAMAMSAKYDPTTVTIVRHLRAGSKFALIWVRDNNSPITREAGIVVDELRIRIQQRNAKTADEFNVDTRVSLDNSARMVQRTYSKVSV